MYQYKLHLTARLPVTQADGKLTVALPGHAPDPIASVLCLETEAGAR